MTIGEIIKEARKKKGLSREDLASEIFVEPSDILNWENNVEIPDASVLDEICLVLDIDRSSLVLAPKPIRTTNYTSSVGSEKEQEEVKVPVRTTNYTPSTPQSTTKMGIDKSRFTTIKVLLIIGTIFTPLLLMSSIFGDSFENPLASLFFLMYLVNIPLCVLTIRAVKKATRKEDLTNWGIISLIFVSLLGGILILSTEFKSISNSNK